MQSDPAARLWRVTRAVAVTPAAALCLLAALLAACELVARSNFARRHLLVPSVDSPVRPFDVQIENIDAFRRDDGHIDCVFVGSSMVMYGIDPDVFGAAFEEDTGRRMRCFSFGIPTIAAADVGVLAGIIRDEVHPWLIVYGFSFRDFSTIANAAPVLETPWVRYRNGEFTLDGWLIEHSKAYRDFVTYRRWASPATRAGIMMTDTFKENGQLPIERTWPRDPEMLRGTIAYAGEELKAGMADSQIEGLSKLLQLRQQGVQVAMVEMPLVAPLAHWVADEPTYQSHLGAIRALAADSGVPLWDTLGLDLVEPDGFGDPWHLNTRGAAVISRWIADQIAGALSRGPLSLPSAANP